MLDAWTITVDPERPLDPQAPLDYVVLAVYAVSVLAAAAVAFTAVFHRKTANVRLVGAPGIVCMCLGIVVQLTTVLVTNKHIDHFDVIRLASCVFWDYWMYMMAFALMFGALTYGVVTSHISALVILPRISSILGGRRGLVDNEACDEGAGEEEDPNSRAVNTIIAAAYRAAERKLAGDQAVVPREIPTKFALYASAKYDRKPEESDEQASKKLPPVARVSVAGDQVDVDVFIPRRSKTKHVPLTLDDYNRLALVEEADSSDDDDDDGDEAYHSAEEAMTEVGGEGNCIAMEEVPLDDHLNSIGSQDTCDHEHGPRSDMFVLPLPAGVFYEVRAGLLRRPLLAAIGLVANRPQIVQLRLSRAVAVLCVLAPPLAIALVATFIPGVVTWVAEANSCYSVPSIKVAVLASIYLLSAMVATVILMARRYTRHQPLSQKLARAIVFGNSPAHISGQGVWPLNQGGSVTLIIAAIRYRLTAVISCLYMTLAYLVSVAATILPPGFCGCIATVRTRREDGIHTVHSYAGDGVRRSWNSMRSDEMASQAALMRPLEVYHTHAWKTTAADMVAAESHRRREEVAAAVLAESIDYRPPPSPSLADHMRIRYGVAVAAFAIGVIPLAVLNFLGLLSYVNGRFVYFLAVDATYWTCLGLVVAYSMYDLLFRSGASMKRALRSYRMRRGLPASLAEALSEGGGQGGDADFWPAFVRHVISQSANTVYLVENRGEASVRAGRMAHVRIKAVNCAISTGVLSPDCQAVFADRVLTALALTTRLKDLDKRIARESYIADGSATDSATWQQQTMQELYLNCIDTLQEAGGARDAGGGLCFVRKMVPAVPRLLLRADTDLPTAVQAGALAFLDMAFWKTFCAEYSTIAAESIVKDQLLGTDLEAVV